MFAQRLERALKREIALLGVMEHQYSGCGKSPVARHWHFLVYAADVSPKLLAGDVSRIWNRYANCDAKEFLPRQGMAHYLAKSAGRELFKWEEYNLELAYPKGCDHIKIVDHSDSYSRPRTYSELRRNSAMRSIGGAHLPKGPRVPLLTRLERYPRVVRSQPHSACGMEPLELLTERRFSVESDMHGDLSPLCPQLMICRGHKNRVFLLSLRGSRRQLAEPESRKGL